MKMIEHVSLVFSKLEETKLIAKSELSHCDRDTEPEAGSKAPRPLPRPAYTGIRRLI